MRLVNSMIMGLLLHSFVCEVSTSVRAVASYKSMDASFNRNIICKKDNSIATISFYSSKDKLLLFHMELDL